MALGQPIFHVRGTSLTPYYSKGSKAVSTFRSSGNSDAAIVVDAGAIGGSVLDFSASGNRAIQFMGQLNWPSTREMAFAWRFKQVTGASAPPKGQNLVFGSTAIGSNSCAGIINWTTGNKLFIDFPDRFGNDIFATSAVSLSWAADQYTTLVVVIDTLSATKTAKIYQGVGTAAPTLVETLVLSGTFSGTYDQNQVSSLNLGYSVGVTGAASSVDYYLDWFAIFDGLIDGTEVSGSAYPTSLNRNGDTLAATSDVRSGVANGVTDGVAVIPTLANTKVDVAGDGGTGTYDGSDRWTDPGEANVRDGTAYKANSTSNNKTGNLDIPLEADVRLGVSYDDATQTGTLAVPAADDVRNGTAVDDATGTLVVPSPSDVRTGVAVDGTVGTLDQVVNKFTSLKLRGNRNE